jgi:trigger factor
MEKTRDAKDKRRIAIMDAIVKETTIELPDLIIDQETLRMEDEFAQDIARMGLNIEGYLASVKKTKEELHKEWRPDAIKRATIQILIGKIADEEKLEADPVKLKEDTDALRARYPDADASRIESFVHMLLTNEKVFDMLESLSV